MALDLKEKLGPLPAWMWALAVVLVGLVGYMFIRNGRSSSAPVATGAGANIDGTVGYQTSGLSGANPNNSTSYAPSDNNQAWLTRVSAQVASNMSKSPSDVYAALQLWLSGQDITPDQKAIVDRALSIGGNPPESVQGTSVVKPNKTFQGFIRNPAGTIAAVFSDGTISEYSNWNVFTTAAQKVGQAQPSWVQLTDSQYNTYTKGSQNYFPGWS